MKKLTIPVLVDRTKDVKFLTLFSNGSSLGLWHRPQLAQIEKFKEHRGVTLIVTIQGGTEHAYEIKNKCEECKIKWFHLPVPGASIETLKYESAKIIAGVFQIFKQMCLHQERVLVHCAAGVHRTGVVAYSLLRAKGFDKPQAMDKLLWMREATYNGVGKGRLRIADFKIIPSLLKKVAVFTGKPRVALKVSEEQEKKEPEIEDLEPVESLEEVQDKAEVVVDCEDREEELEGAMQEQEGNQIDLQGIKA